MYTDVDRITTARVLIEQYGWNQNKIRQLFKATTGAKLWALVQICLYEESNNFDLGLFKSITKLGKYNQSKVVKMAQRLKTEKPTKKEIIKSLS